MTNKKEAHEIANAIRSHCGLSPEDKMWLCGDQYLISDGIVVETIYAITNSGAFVTIGRFRVDLSRSWFRSPAAIVKKAVLADAKLTDYPRARRVIQRLEETFVKGNKATSRFCPCELSRGHRFWTLFSQGTRLIFTSAAKIERSRERVLACISFAKLIRRVRGRDGFGKFSKCYFRFKNRDHLPVTIDIGPIRSEFILLEGEQLDIAFEKCEKMSEINIVRSDGMVSISAHYNPEVFIVQRGEVVHWSNCDPLRCDLKYPPRMGAIQSWNELID